MYICVASSTRPSASRWHTAAWTWPAPSSRSARARNATAHTAKPARRAVHRNQAHSRCQGTRDSATAHARKGGEAAAMLGRQGPGASWRRCGPADGAAADRCEFHAAGPLLASRAQAASPFPLSRRSTADIAAGHCDSAGLRTQHVYQLLFTLQGRFILARAPERVCESEAGVTRRLLERFFTLSRTSRQPGWITNEP
jgi:hypothetical protein